MRDTSGRLSSKTGLVGHGFSFSKKLLLESAKLEPSHSYSVQLIRSVVVSAIAVIVNFAGSYLLKDVLGVYYLLSAALSFFMGVLVNYYLSIKWVFATRQLKSKHVEFIVFVVITTVGLILNLLIIAAMVERIKTGYWTALIAATIVVFFWNFLARKKVLY